MTAEPVEVNVPITAAQAETLAEESDPMLILEYADDGALLMGNGRDDGQLRTAIWLDAYGNWKPTR